MRNFNSDRFLSAAKPFFLVKINPKNNQWANSDNFYYFSKGLLSSLGRSFLGWAEKLVIQRTKKINMEPGPNSQLRKKDLKTSQLGC